MKIPSESFPEGWEDKFHVWRMDWTEERIKIYLDNQQLSEVDLNDTENSTRPIKNPFKQPLIYC